MDTLKKVFGSWNVVGHWNCSTPVFEISMTKFLGLSLATMGLNRPKIMLLVSKFRLTLVKLPLGVDYLGFMARPDFNLGL